MKTWKRLSALALALCMAAGILIAPDMNAFAKTKLSSKSITITTNQTYNSNGSIGVTYSKKGSSIKNLKSNSKNLLVKQVSQYNDSASLEFFAKKNGNYKVTFDVYNKKGKKESHFTVNVKAVKTSTSPIKSVSFAGKKLVMAQNYFYSTATKTGRFKVNLNKGYKINYIQMTYSDKSGKEKTKGIKNNAKITLSDYAYKYDGMEEKEDGSWKYSYSNSMWAHTTIWINVQNTKTKRTDSYQFEFHKLAK